MIVLYAFLFSFGGCFAGILAAYLTGHAIYDYAKLKRRQYRRNKRLQQELSQ